LVNPESIVISVPARELAKVPIPGSVFDVAVLHEASSVSPDLRLAVELISTAFLGEGRKEPLRCVARPEIFTHGPALHWLRRSLGPVTEHISLSDGTSIKLIPQLRNHLFTYGLQSHQRHVDFKKLLRRAPELLAQCQSQVNSFHRFSSAQGLASEPTPTLVLRPLPAAATAVWSYGFYLNPHSLEDSAERMLNWGELEEPPITDFEKITYIPLTESAAKDANFQRMVAELVASTYFDRGKCLVLRLPTLGCDVTDCMRLALEGIRDSRLHLPQVRANNIFFLSGDLSEELLAKTASRVSLVLHETF